MEDLTMKKWNECSRKQQVALVIVALCLLGGGVGYKVYAETQYKQEVSQAIKGIKEENKELAAFLDELESLRDQENPSFLKKDVSLNKLEASKKALEEVTSKLKTRDFSEVDKEKEKQTKLVKEIEAAQESIETQLLIQGEINSLFETKEKQAINGTEIHQDLAIKDDLELEEVEAIEKQLKEKLQTITLPHAEDEKMSWEQTADGLLSAARKQVEIISSLRKEVGQLFKDNKPIDTTSNKKIEELEKKINEVKNGKAKKDLTDRLKKVKEAVNKKNEADKKKKEQEEAAKLATQEAEVAQQAVTQTAPSTTETPTYSENNSYGGGTTNNYSQPSGSTSTGGGNASTGGGGSTSGGSSSTGSGGGGYASQEELNQQAEDAANADWSSFFD